MDENQEEVVEAAPLREMREKAERTLCKLIVSGLRKVEVGREGVVDDEVAPCSCEEM